MEWRGSKEDRKEVRMEGIQWNYSKPDTSGASCFVCCMEVSANQGYIVHMHNCIGREAC